MKKLVKLFLSMFFLFVVSAVFLLPTNGLTAPISVFYSDFNNGVNPDLSGVTTIESVQGFDTYGFSGSFLRNSTGGSFGGGGADGVPGLETTLTLTGLAAHNSINISFLLAIIDSWDRSFSANGSDLFNVSIDGNIIFSESFSTHPASSFVQTYDAPSGGLLTPSSFVDLGFRDTNRDSAYDMGADSIFTDISHTGDTLVIGLFASGGGLQGGVNESWAIDNLRVEINTVPEPSTILLLATGFINLIGFRRKFN